MSRQQTNLCCTVHFSCRTSVNSNFYWPIKKSDKSSRDNIFDVLHQHKLLRLFVENSNASFKKCVRKQTHRERRDAQSDEEQNFHDCRWKKPPDQLISLN